MGTTLLNALQNMLMIKLLGAFGGKNSNTTDIDVKQVVPLIEIHSIICNSCKNVCNQIYNQNKSVREGQENDLKKKKKLTSDLPQLCWLITVT